ncbi:hypothetical protein [Oceanicoccus sp. KOV_DT_Chl]|uniref:hypothetical protein n=1 Tax=Oceanicoccus sp. KOV_DT_Chl TaxID=1904639 RepID=UPI000C7D4B85|nr:hypothetical protein [Oceanicoccus sp. KOV_DT_Chl]
MTAQNFTQSAPLAPPHHELLVHPLVHFPESPTLLDCQDILANSADLVDLFGHIIVNDDSNSGGLSAEAAAGFYWLIHMLKHTLRYVSLTLSDLRASQKQHQEQLKQSILFRALQSPDKTSQDQLDKALEACLGISRTDINAFIHLLEVDAPSRSDDEPASQNKSDSV